MGSHAGLPLTCCSHAMSCVHVGDGVQGAERSFELSVVGTKMPGELVRRFPHLYGCTLLSVPQEVQEQVGGGRELGETVIKMLPVCGLVICMCRTVQNTYSYQLCRWLTV